MEWSWSLGGSCCACLFSRCPDLIALLRRQGRRR
jgi:hypothetical protein